ncbi:tRNA 2-thiouridine(34) synthase MnmA [Chloroflexota bacterium]
MFQLTDCFRHFILRRKNTVKVLLAMSGGVDSSVAAALLKDKGYEVSGITMRICSDEDFSSKRTQHGCYGPGEKDDIEDARNVAESLGIPFHTFDLIDEYKTEVLDYFLREYQSGKTPNPCLRCNSRVKFGALFRRARESGVEFDYFASGHYAKTVYDESSKRYQLKKAKDARKDQSYFISMLSQEQLSHLLLPIGDYTKTEVRAMAADFNLVTRDKPESQDFIAGGYSSLIGEASRGQILDKQGNVIGEHRGIPFYTIGQRKRLGVQTKEPLYVTEIDPDNNAIIVGNREESFHDEFTASELNWISVEKLEQPIKAKVKIRYAHTAAEATVTPVEEDRVFVEFEKPQRAITPGQAAVFYRDETVLGSGTIERERKQ